MRSILALTFDMIHSLKQNWKAYTMEAICLGLFMVSASFFATLLYYPASPLLPVVSNADIRDVLMGVAMGLSAILIIYSPMGKLSGAHMNPAITFTFWRLGKIKTPDMVYYALFQCIGGVVAVYIMHLLLGKPFQDPHVNYVVTVPGKFGVAGAFITEIIIAFIMMTMVLITTNRPRTAKYTGVFAGILVATYVVVSGPISGFGMNPARSLASAVPSGIYHAFWVYITAPVIGMTGAASLHKYFNGKVICAKFHHSHLYDCIFNCGYCNHQSNLNDEQKISTNNNQYRPISTHSD